jgi:hypothetical protein
MARKLRSGYLKTVCDYVHLNPARAGMLKGEQLLSDFAWSSYPEYLKRPSKRPVWLRVDRLLGEWRIPKDSETGRRIFSERMEARRREVLAGQFKKVERGWCLGSEAFRRELLEQVTAGPGPSHYGAEVQEGAQVRAERLVLEGLKRRRWTENDLASRRKGDQGKVRLAIALRAKTTMPLAWIAGRLHMGSRGYLTWLLHRESKK